MVNEVEPTLIDSVALAQAVRQQGEGFQAEFGERHAHLFAEVPLLIPAQQMASMQAVITAVERVVRLPAWLGRHDETRCQGVFFGYDFHLNDSGAHLIEINTNAGGAFLNALLLDSQRQTALPGKALAADALEQVFMAMFQAEWRLEQGERPLKSIAIIDEQPQEQYLYPEFLLAQQMFARAGLRAFIADPAALSATADGLYLGGEKIDLVYNRLTDFALERYPALLLAYQARQVVLTPHPQSYARYADKRNLVRLSDAAALRALGAEEATITVLQGGVPQTRQVEAHDAERWWDERKQWFFKPVSGYGAKGAYRGDKLTRRVFDEILSADYVAQRLAVPGECVARAGDAVVNLKYDVRCYVYDGQIQLVAARLYQGQTTNFRTPGGGFALVREAV
jgi:hypothetical protein